MPGLILEIQTTVGSEVKKDEPLMILEVMKMENVLCSPVDGIIEKIVVTLNKLLKIVSLLNLKHEKNFNISNRIFLNWMLVSEAETVSNST